MTQAAGRHVAAFQVSIGLCSSCPSGALLGTRLCPSPRVLGREIREGRTRALKGLADTAHMEASENQLFVTERSEMTILCNQP